MLILTWLQGLWEESKAIKFSSLNLVQFFCFILLNLGPKLEFLYVENGLLTATGVHSNH